MPTPRRVFLNLVAYVAVTVGAAMNQVWTFGPRQRRGLARFQARLDIERLEEYIRLLAAWSRRSKYRPRYTRQEWSRNIEYAVRWELTAAEMARDLVVSNAIAYRRLALREQGGFAAPYVKPTTPCVRIDDSRRALVVDMAVGGFEYDTHIANHIHSHGERISPRSVGRIRADAGIPKAARRKARRKTRSARKPGLVDTPDAAALTAGLVSGPTDRRRPRKARLVHTLAGAFAECIARDTLWSMDEESLDIEADVLRRTRLSQLLAILLARFRRIPPHKRPHYTGVERGDILAFKSRFRLSNKTLARWFLLDRNTLSAWNLDVDHPERRKRPLVEPIADVKTAVARLAKYLPPVPARLTQTVAETVAALAETIHVDDDSGERRARDRTAPMP